MGGYWSNTCTKEEGEKNKKKRKRESDSRTPEPQKVEKVEGGGGGVKRQQRAQLRHHPQGETTVVEFPPINPFVLRRTSSMYFDEDGDLAHEFYQEERMVLKSGVVRWSMRKIIKNLMPQGEIDLPYPRLHVDFPVVLLDSTAILIFSGQK